uniref:Mitochondrial 2-oxodicarboxylate carrier n=1 Tax=Panagrolaimus sp. PS1159 TaxID=55785 RepID=A0AC35F757_9BILA
MEKVKEGSRQIVAGGSAGLVEICLMHPLDLIKTRLQIQGGNYKGLTDCFNQTLKNEGVLGFYKGILPPILAETPKRATKFFTFEQYKKAFAIDGIPVWMSLSLAGLGSGLTEAVIVCPFETVKVRMQSDRSSGFEKSRSTAAVAREIIKENGFGTKGIFRGLDATLGRNGVWNMFYFGIYHNLKHFIPIAEGNSQGSVSLRLLLGFTAGSLASIANIPFDVAKSRIQGPQPSTGRIYHTCFQSMALVARQEGFFALYRGLLPKVMRLGPGGAIMLVVYETVYDFLQMRT